MANSNTGWRLKIYLSGLFIVFFLIGGCSSVPKKTEPELQVVPYVDINRYLGKWYEIARYPNWFEEGCFSPTAFYEKINNEEIKVVNRCYKNGRQGELDEAVGKATLVKDATNAKLEVQFFWPFKGNYWIIELDKEYQYAVISEPDRQYLWILSRSPEMDLNTLKMLKDKIRQKGFDLNYLILSPH